MGAASLSLTLHDVVGYGRHVLLIHHACASMILCLSLLSPHVYETVANEGLLQLDSVSFVIVLA